MSNQLKCYFCEQLAVSKEHVPPKCLFPEEKDIKGLNFRKRLITVPSCDIHNSNKSDDDEFLMLSLSGLISNNEIGQYHFHTKANRAIRRKGMDFINKQVLRNYKIGKIKPSGNNNHEELVSIGTPNLERLISCFDHISRGLYYHKFGKSFEGTVKVMLGFVHYTNQNQETLKNVLKKRCEMETELNLGLEGANPYVFHYEFHKADEFGMIGLKLVFYGNAEIYIAFQPTNTNIIKDNLAMMLINGGIKTFIQLDDDKFEFN